MITAVCNRDLSAYEVVSFDVYDTAVLRKTAEPRDVFLWIEQRLIDLHGSLASGFASWREYAELELVEKVWAIDRSNEVTLDDIYDALIHNHPELSGLKEELKNLELSFERELTIPNPLIFDVYQKALRENKRVIFISDIYLPRSHMEQILSASGYTDYEKLYVSNEVGKNKASGTLYQHVIQELKIPGNKIIHFGDNAWSDVSAAQANGVDAQLVPNSLAMISPARYFPKNHSREIGDSLFLSLIKQYQLTNKAKSATDIGYEVLGPLVYGFLNWTIDHATDRDIKQLYFIAREGWFLKNAYDVIAEKLGLNIASHYLLASRRSLLFPFVEDEVAKNIMGFALSTKPVRLEKYLKSIEVSPTQEQLKKAGFSSLDQVIDPMHNPKEHEQLSNLLTALEPEIISRAAEEKRLYLQYMESIGMLSTDHVGVVDSGWFGSGQSRLYRFLQENNTDTKLSGFYFATHKDGEKNFVEQSTGLGYLFQFDTFNNDIEEFLEIARIIEVFLSAPAESFKRFREVDDELQPAYVKENTDPKLDPIIEDIQEGALKFIHDYLELDPKGELSPSRRLICHLFMEFIRAPDENEAKQVGSLPYEANMLQDEANNQFAYANKKLTDIFKNPIKTTREFDAANWRAGYLRNLKSTAVRWYLKLTSRYFLEKNLVYQAGKKLKKRLRVNRFKEALINSGVSKLW